MIGRKTRLSCIALASLLGAAMSGLPSLAAEEPAARITAIAEEAMAKHGLRAIIVRVVIDGKIIVTLARGESMTGVPATPDMHFRNGAVAFAYLATIALQLAEEKRIGLDDKLANYLPDLPHADRITLRMLLNMTSGYADYVPDETFNLEFYANPFQHWTPEELINIGVSKPLRFEPGTNFGYAHTGYVIMGRVIEKVTGKSLGEVMAERIFVPLGLRDTVATVTAEIQPPVLHAFSSERREPLGIAPGVRFYEESTFWNPSWTTAHGDVQTSNIYDLITTAIAVGTGALLSPESYEAMTGPALVGFGKPTAECPACRTLDEKSHYGLGVFLYGPWIAQSPLFGGYAATEGYLPAREIAIAVAVTFSEAGFDERGDYRGNASTDVFREIAKYLAPDETP
jgi:CubicO group peptidase (beta-lactamase class C family)